MYTVGIRKASIDIKIFYKCKIYLFRKSISFMYIQLTVVKFVVKVFVKNKIVSKLF